MGDIIARIDALLANTPQSEITQDQRLATADETTPADGIASPLHPLVRWRRKEVERWD